MEETNDQPKVIYTSPTPLFKKKLFQVGLLLAISPLFVLAFLWLSTQPLFQPKQSSTPVATSSAVIKEENLPIALNILQNPLVYEWRGSVEGTLVAKDEKSITISDNQNHKLIIPVIPSTDVIYGTKFYKRDIKNKVEQFINVTHQDIPIGTKLRGDFFVAAREKDKIIGSSFEVIEP